MKFSSYVLSTLLLLAAYASPLAVLTFVTPASLVAQQPDDVLKWTDISGSRTIDAKFVRLEGESVVIEKSDGTEVTVPLNKLNLKSQAQAKRMANPKAFEKKPSTPKEMKEKPAATDAADDKETAEPTDAKKADSSSTATTAKLPEPSIPANLSAKDALAFVAQELSKDNYAVLVDTMPREQLELAQEGMQKLVSKLNKSSFDSIKALLKRSTKVMAEKKSFILNYPKIPADAKPRLSAHYDTIVALMQEINSSPLVEMKNWNNGDIGACMPVIFRLTDVYGSRFVETEKAINPSVPATMSTFIAVWGAPVKKQDLVDGKVRISGQNGDTATLEFIGPTGAAASVALEQSNGRWYPKPSEVTEAATKQLRDQIAQLDNVDAKQISGNLMLGLAVVGGLVGQLERANTQEEFNEQMDQLFNSAAGMIPAGPGGAIAPIAP